MKEKLKGLLFSSRPDWAMMPGFVAENFAENLLFLLSALERTGIAYTAHFGTLLGAVRLGGVAPWDEDADIYVLDEDRASIERRLRALLEEHGFQLIYDERDFFWVRQDPWWAGQGHIGLSFLPRPNGHLPDHPEDPAIAPMHLLPLAKIPFHGTWIWGPAQPEPILVRLYGATGTVQTMARFTAPRISSDSEEFWRRARAGSLDWTAISARFHQRSRFAHVSTFPWWWANGAYNIGIKQLRKWGDAP